MDLISREDTIDALWKALYEYEDKTEKQFQESDELDVGDWILHRIFVQNMSDIDRQTILDLPSAQPMPWIPCSERLPEKEGYYLVSNSWRTFEACFLEGEWYSRKLDFLLDGVNAWMPLPEPYKGGQDARQ